MKGVLSGIFCTAYTRDGVINIYIVILSSGGRGLLVSRQGCSIPLQKYIKAASAAPNSLALVLYPILSYPILLHIALHFKKKKRRENAMKYTRLWESNFSIRHLVNADNKSRALRKLRREEKKNYACCLELYVLHPNGRKGG